MKTNKILHELVNIATSRDRNLFGGWQKFEVVIGGVGFFDGGWKNYMDADMHGRGELLSIEEVIFNHNFAKVIWGKEEMFSGGKYVIEWEADWRANYLDGKKRTDKQAIEIMKSDLEWFRKNGDVLPKYLVMLKKLVVIDSIDEKIKFIYESIKD